jgi:hypothetical protein
MVLPCSNGRLSQAAHAQQVLMRSASLHRKSQETCWARTFKRQLKPILKKLGLDKAAHAFRPGIASLLDHLHAPMKVRQGQDRLGHEELRAETKDVQAARTQRIAAESNRRRFSSGENRKPTEYHTAFN